MKLNKISAKEVYIIFFGNHQFEDENGCLYNNFQTFYNTYILTESNMLTSEIYPEPPAYFTSLYEKNHSEILNFHDYSIRKTTFTHSLKQFYLPKSCDVLTEERIYWISPKEFIIEKIINLNGLPFSDRFTPRIVYQIIESADSLSTTINTGHYVHYTRDTPFKSKINQTTDSQNVKN